MNRRLRAIAGLCLVGLVVGCGSSPPVNYYVLSAQERAAPRGATPTVGVGPVTIPEYLNRDNLVTARQGNALTVASSERWAEPLQDGIRRVLTVNLAGLLNTQGTRLYPWRPESAPDHDVRVSLLGMDIADTAATLEAEWQVLGKAPTGPHLTRLQLALPAGTARPEDIAAAYSQLLFQLSEVIAASISSGNG